MYIRVLKLAIQITMTLERVICLSKLLSEVLIIAKLKFMLVLRLMPCTMKGGSCNTDVNNSVERLTDPSHGYDELKRNYILIFT